MDWKDMALGIAGYLGLMVFMLNLFGWIVLDVAEISGFTVSVESLWMICIGRRGISIVYLFVVHLIGMECWIMHWQK
jgi:hypothetical protein